VSTRTATATARRPAGRPAARQGTRRRRTARRRLTALIAFALGCTLLIAVLPSLKHAAKEIALPLRHEDIIRQQAAAKNLDPSLVAAVIYAESKFTNATSAAGAQGLMQITPATAHAIATRTGGIAFRTADLSTPQVNIAYGTWYLRYLLDHYDDNVVAALAAYNAGMGNTDRWVSAATARGTTLTPHAIPFGETRRYVEKVLDAQARYRREYRHELGLG
jgi:soluble lytic murein transglycosylase